MFINTLVTLSGSSQGALDEAQQTLRAAEKEAQRVETLEAGVREAEAELIVAEGRVASWQLVRLSSYPPPFPMPKYTTAKHITMCTKGRPLNVQAGRDAQAEAILASDRRQNAVERAREAQRAVWDVKEQLRVMDRAAKRLEDQVAQQESALKAIDTKATVAAQEEEAIGEQITQYKEELAWREKLKGDEAISASLQVKISEAQVILKEVRKRKITLYERKKETSRQRRAAEKAKLVDIEARHPVQLEDRKRQRYLVSVEHEERQLGAQYESQRAAGRKAEEELGWAQQYALECRRRLGEEKRALVLAARKHAALETRRAQVKREAGDMRSRFELERSRAEAEAARLAAVEAARAEEERVIAERKARAEALIAAGKAAAEAEQKALEERIEKAKGLLQHFTIGQRVRTHDGRVGTVCNIKLYSASKFEGPGMTIKLGDEGKGGGSVFVGPHEVMGPFDYGRVTSDAMPKGKDQRLDASYGRRPLDGALPGSEAAGGALPHAARERERAINVTRPGLSYTRFAADEGAYHVNAELPAHYNTSPLKRPKSSAESVHGSSSGSDATSGVLGSPTGAVAVDNPFGDSSHILNGTQTATAVTGYIDYTVAMGSRRRNNGIRRTLSPLRLAASTEPSLHDIQSSSSSSLSTLILPDQSHMRSSMSAHGRRRRRQVQGWEHLYLRVNC